jgi:hypothetical protein
VAGPHHEQVGLGRGAGEDHGRLAPVDLGLGTELVRLGDEDLDDREAELPPAPAHVVAHRRLGELVAPCSSRSRCQIRLRYCAACAVPPGRPRAIRRSTPGRDRASAPGGCSACSSGAGTGAWRTASRWTQCRRASSLIERPSRSRSRLARATRRAKRRVTVGRRWGQLKPSQWGRSDRRSQQINNRRVWGPRWPNVPPAPTWRLHRL